MGWLGLRPPPRTQRSPESRPPAQGPWAARHSLPKEVGGAIFSLWNWFFLLETLWAGPTRTACPLGQVTWAKFFPSSA